MYRYIFIATLVVLTETISMAKNNPIPFKTGWVMVKDDIEAFTRQTGFSLPPDIIAAYGRWNGGCIDGWFVFDVPSCEKLAVEKFLSFRPASGQPDPMGDFATTEIKNNPHLSGQRIEQIELLPFAIVDGSVAPKEKSNELNCRSVLALKRGMGAQVFLVSGKDGRSIKIAESLVDLLSRMSFWFQFLEPEKGNQ